MGIAVGIVAGLVIGLAYVGAASLYISTTAPDRPQLPTCTLQAGGVQAQTLQLVPVPGGGDPIPMPHQLLVFDVYDCDGFTIIVPDHFPGGTP